MARSVSSLRRFLKVGFKSNGTTVTSIIIELVLIMRMTSCLYLEHITHPPVNDVTEIKINDVTELKIVTFVYNVIYNYVSVGLYIY